MTSLILIEMPDEMAQQIVDENIGLKEDDNEPESLRGIMSALVWDVVADRDLASDWDRLVKVSTWKTNELTDAHLKEE